jgi:hypothetical protein
MIIIAYDKWVMKIAHMMCGLSCTDDGYMAIKTWPHGS